MYVLWLYHQNPRGLRDFVMDSVPVVFQQSKCKCALCTRTISIYCWELASSLFFLNLQQEVKGYISWFSCAIHIRCILSSELWSDTGSIWDREHFIQHPILSDSADCISHTLFCFPRKSLRKLFHKSRLYFRSVQMATEVFKKWLVLFTLSHKLEFPDRE
jgi:hypothetical protein